MVRGDFVGSRVVIRSRETHRLPVRRRHRAHGCVGLVPYPGLERVR